MTTAPTMKEIADHLVEFREAKDKYKCARMKLSKMAVELGMEQKEAIEGANAACFLDGFLVSAGMLQAHRRNDGFDAEGGAK